MNQIDLHKRCAVVTGGAQGIGLAIAERFLASGASVCLWDRDESLLKKTADALASKGTVKPVVMDVTDLNSVRNAAQKTEELLGGIDILVCNAGIAGPTAKTWEYPPEEWQQVIDIDLTGVFNCLHVISPMMIAQNYGRIVNVASVAGKDGNPNAAPYSAAKAGVIALTKSLGKELAGYDIAVNCITPAAAKTRIFDQISADQIQYMLSKIPRNRFLKVEEAASMVAWLCSEENSFTTGGVFDLSGGRSTY
ncbi:MAG TPA: SDR family oxidoreductase [Candidatus Lambdaproteobacteria bacterium]|jgi:3-oxoacyl-[acyl-carrier protein] reductase|nr:SDR family oxidoreductase [Candidatus Lambdaproteobacteria bacterium]HIC08102.1 SDR family oxidoreductase [Candidatus Lambdaproteobacteria bacterium]HIG76521.1 SDR family oxidoreductase [Candidatus Lambdaproteobacteria bacterium]|tara:strand:+ start:126 stop:878 length:753 start_codon:yes stop_codon:yes gene_type:complete